MATLEKKVSKSKAEESTTKTKAAAKKTCLVTSIVCRQ